MTIPRVWRALLASMVAICLASGGLLWLAGPAAADPVSVTGTVTTDAGTLTGWTSVQFYDREQGVVENVSTNTGVYSLNVEPGTYDVTIEGDAAAGGVSTHVRQPAGPGRHRWSADAGLPHRRPADPGQPHRRPGQSSRRVGDAALHQRASSTGPRSTCGPRAPTSPSQPRTLWGFGYPVDEGARAAPCLVGATRSGDADQDPTYYERVERRRRTPTRSPSAIPDSVTLSGRSRRGLPSPAALAAPASASRPGTGDPVDADARASATDSRLRDPGPARAPTTCSIDVSNDRGGIRLVARRGRRR